MFFRFFWEINSLVFFVNFLITIDYFFPFNFTPICASPTSASDC